jgi:Xaa-Pro aminopeptidase
MAHAPSSVLGGRHRRLRESLAGRGLDALVLTHLPNIFYLTNFPGSSAVVLLTSTALLFITDFRYVAAVEAALASPTGCPGASLVPVESSYDETLVDLLRSRDLRRVGFEAAHVPFAQHARWAAALGQDGRGEAADGGSGIALMPADRIVESLRVRKDEHEVATLRAAAGLLPGVFERIVAEVRPGRSEREVAARVDWIIKDAGFERTAFETIVASGPNSALPHARPGARLVAPGDLVVLDFGGVYDGYCVDLSRTVSIGDPDYEARRVYSAVSAAHAAALAASREGATSRTIDRAARGTLEQEALGDRFGHGTGHGLGIEVHEEPWLRRTKPPKTDRVPEVGDQGSGAAGDTTIEAGMVFTIEPGVYVPGWGGVRIEDDVLVTPDGPEILTRVRRELRIV